MDGPTFSYLPYADAAKAAALLSQAGVLCAPSTVAPVVPFCPVQPLSEADADQIIAIMRETLW